MTRLLVLGSGGQVGHEAVVAAAAAGWQVVGRDHRAVDISDAAAVARCVAQSAPTLAINAAAYTAVDRAESEPDKAYAVNAAGAGHVAAACARARVPLIHISTDYVFDGTKSSPYVEDDRVNPLSVYGASKEAGEQAVRRAQPHHVILRTSWVFAPHGSNFLRTMLRLRGERPRLGIVDDQKGGPTAASDIAAACIAIGSRLAAGGEPGGTYHFTGAPATTWFGFAQAVFLAAAHAGLSVPAVHPITTAEYPAPARRPANSVLDCSRVMRAFAVRQPDWRPRVSATVAALVRAQGRAEA